MTRSRTHLNGARPGVEEAGHPETRSAAFLSTRSTLIASSTATKRAVFLLLATLSEDTAPRAAPVVGLGGLLGGMVGAEDEEHHQKMLEADQHRWKQRRQRPENWTCW